MLGYDWPRLHALLNDLPAALLVVAVVFDLAALVTRRQTLRHAAFWTLMAGVIGAGLAVVSGLQAEKYIAHGEAVHRVMKTHETLGLISLGLFAALALWRILREKRMGMSERSFALVLSVGGVGVLLATGLYGGRLVFEHAAGIPSEVLEAELLERTQPHHHAGGEQGGSEAGDHVDPPGTPPHSHPAPPTKPPHTHTDPPGTPPHTH
jgi:uncharacterized membrane protein